jgi:hypothetical protein
MCPSYNVSAAMAARGNRVRINGERIILAVERAEIDWSLRYF